MRLKQIIKSSSLLLSLIVIGKTSGFFKDFLIAYYFGVNEQTDALFLAAYLSSLLYTAIFSSLPVVIISCNSKILRKKMIHGSLHSVILLYILISSLLGMSSFAFSKDIIDIMAPGLTEGLKTLTAHYLKLMVITFPLSTYVGLVNVFQSLKKITWPSYCIPILNNLFFCISLLFFHEKFTFMLLGGLLSWLCLLVFNTVRESISFKSILSDLKLVSYKLIDYKFIFLTMFFLWIEQLNNYIPVYFFSLGSEGGVSIYGYSSRVNLLVLSVSIMILTTHLLPNFSKIYIEKGSDGLLGYINKITDRVLFFSLPIAILFHINSASIIKLLFFRGDFSFNDVTKVSLLFRVMIFLIPVYIFRDIINRVCFVLNESKLTLYTTVAIFLLNSILSYFFFTVYGLLGVIYSLLIVSVLHVLLLLKFLELKYKDKILRGIVNSSINSIVLAFVPFFLLKPFSLFEFSFSLLYLFIYLGISLFKGVGMRFNRSDGFVP